MRHTSGNILPLALVLTSVVLMAGVGIGIVVTEGSQRALETTQSTAAYYLADSGIERQLFEVRKKDARTDQLSVLNEQYPNQGSWAFYGGYAQTMYKLFSSIATSSFEVVDVFNPDQVRASGIDELRITWSSSSDCGGSVAGVETGFAEWDTTGGALSVSDQYTIQRSGEGDTSMTISLDPQKAYRFRIRALGCTAAPVYVGAYAGGMPQTFPGDMTLAAEGTYGRATQKIGVTMPKGNVLSGVFGYVIFSECTLLKGSGMPTCPP